MPAGTVLLENIKIPEGSMVVGVPGKVRAQTAERHRKLIKHIADSYLRHSRQYKNEGLE